MKEKLKEFFKNPYVLITLVYFLAHFFLLILSGCWWDDWTFITHNTNYINQVASQSGRPEWNFLIPFCWSLPNNGRILIFFLYYLNSIFVYIMLKNSELFDKKESLIIALLFTVVPVNDARLLISNFSYTVGLFFFWMAFMFFVFWNKMELSVKKTVFRICILALFFISFILNSVLAYYYILIGYLFVLELRKIEETNVFKKVLFAVKNVLVKYPDFFIWPFVYYGFNKTFFPTYGEVFGEYNAVTLSGLIKCFIYIPLSVVKVFVDICKKCISSINLITVIPLIVALIILLIRKDKKEKTNTKPIDSIKYFIYGLFVLIMGLFPYIMVRGRRIDTMGVKGRDAVLLPLGVAIITFSLICLLKGKIKKIVTVLVIISAIIGMNNLYLEWQKDYYYQLSMEKLFVNKIIADNDTFFLIDLNESEIEGQRYYSLNTNAYNVYGDQTRFFIPKVSNLYILESKETVEETIKTLDYSHMMRDYKPDDLYFDAILNYENDLSWNETVQLKLYEMFDQEKFDSIISSKGKLDVEVVDDDFTIELLKKYDNGEVYDDQDVLDFYLEYAK